MKIVTTTCVFPPCTDMTEIICRLKNCKFNYLDMSFDYCVQNKNYPFMTEEYEKWAYDIKECADKSGVFFTHSHAPFHAGYRGTLVEKTLRCSSILGIKYTVVHPLWDKGNGVFYEGEEFIDVNKKAILPILEAAERYNVIILSENLLWGDSIKSTAISRLVKEVNSPYFGWCYDTGHANTMKDDCNELLKCDIAPLSLHIHDNSGKYYSDEHLIPFDGNIDWRKLLSILKAIGYKGELVLEAHHQSIASPDEQRDKILKRLYCSAENLMDIYNTL